MEKLRIFVAGDIEPKVKKNIVDDFLNLGLDYSKLRLQTADKIHLTFKFWAHFPVSDIDKLVIGIAEAAAQMSKLAISFNQPLIFGGSKKARVLIIVPDQIFQLEHMMDTLESVLEQSGLAARELRRFRPHLTLARVKGEFSNQDRDKFMAWSPDYQTEISNLILYESRLSSRGSQYSILKQFSL